MHFVALPNPNLFFEIRVRIVELKTMLLEKENKTFVQMTLATWKSGYGRTPRAPVVDANFKTNVPKSSSSFVRLSVAKNAAVVKTVFFGFRNVLNVRLLEKRFGTIGLGSVAHYQLWRNRGIRRKTRSDRFSLLDRCSRVPGRATRRREDGKLFGRSRES